MLRSVQLKDHMIHNPLFVTPDTDLLSAIHEIIVNKLSGICVVDNEGQLVGMLSELDCLEAELKGIYSSESGIGLVSDVMRTEVPVASVDDDIVDLAADLVAKKHRRRPVVENGKLVGLITCRQLLRVVKEFSAPKDPSEYKANADR